MSAAGAAEGSQREPPLEYELRDLEPPSSARVTAELADCRVTIATDQPHVKVAWRISPPEGGTEMNKRLAATAILVAAVAAAAGLFASPSSSAENCGVARSGQPVPQCTVALTGAGPSPSTLKMVAAGYVIFDNTDSVSHTVVFANGLCSLTLTPGDQGGPGTVNGSQHPDCNDPYPFPFYVGSYAYTVDGKFPGTVATTPLRRVVTLTARTQTIRRGTRLRLHGQVKWDDQAGGPRQTKGHLFPPLIVLARHDGRHPFEPIATVPVKSSPVKVEGVWTLKVQWKLKVQPAVTTTYIAKVTGQLPEGQIWTKARSRPFTVRIRH